MRALTIAILVMACLCTAGCGVGQMRDELARRDAESTSLEANRVLVLRAHEEVWSRGNLEVVDEIYAPDYVAHWAYGEDTDRNGIKTMIAEARAAFPDMTEDIVHVVAEGDLVVTHFISSGTFTGELNGLQPSGARLSRPEIAVHRIADGKIVEQWTVSDQLTLMKQLGLM